MQALLTVLVAAGFVLAQPHAAPAQDTPPRAISQNPTGEGDPDGITCRPPQPLPLSRMMGPQVCKTNRTWAQYRKDGMDVAADGVHDVPVHSKMACHSEMANSGGGGSAGMSRVGSGMVCE